MSPENRLALVEAFRHAVQGEIRYGVREDCKAEIDARWAHLVMLLTLKKKK